MGFPKSKRGYQSARLMPLVFFMTYTIFDVENDTMTQFTALDNGNVEIVNSFLSGSSPLTVQISIDELQKLAIFLKQDLSGTNE